MNVLLIDNKSAHLEKLEGLVIEKLGSVEFVRRDPRAMKLVDAQAADLIIISGGAGRSIYKNSGTFNTVVEHAVAAAKPTIGICLGAEAIAVKFGGQLIEMPVRRVGNIRCHVVSDSVAMLGVGSSFMAYEFHKWLIATPLTTELRLMASSKDGAEVFRHVRLPLWGLQFHPEVRRLDNPGHIVFENILRFNGYRVLS